jgi:hypothetical protein
MNKLIPSKNHHFLKGAKPRVNELVYAWQVLIQFIKGFRTMHFVGPCITVFGSARFKEEHPYYKMAQEFGKRIAQLGFTTLTGVDPGQWKLPIEVHLKMVDKALV